MDQPTDIHDPKLAQPVVTICSQANADSPSPNPSTTPGGQVYVPLGGNLPDGLLPPCKHGYVSSPTEVRRFANPAPLGCCAFALTSFVSNCANLYIINKTTPSIDIALALTYGGVVQLLAGMWEMALGNTFGATSFCSYGGYWITFAVMSDLDITVLAADAEDSVCQKEIMMGLFMIAWFIFTTLMLLCTLKSSLAMFLLFFFLDLNYLLLGIAHFHCGSTSSVMAPVQRVGGVCGLVAAGAAWYNAFAGVFDASNGFFTVPLGHFPWSSAVRAHQAKYKEV